MDLSAKTRDEIEQLLARNTRDELIDIIFPLAVVEQHFTPAEVARRSGMTKRTILADIHPGHSTGSITSALEIRSPFPPAA